MRSFGFSISLLYVQVICLTLASRY